MAEKGWKSVFIVKKKQKVNLGLLNCICVYYGWLSDRLTSHVAHFHPEVHVKGFQFNAYIIIFSSSIKVGFHYPVSYFELRESQSLPYQNNAIPNYSAPVSPSVRMYSSSYIYTYLTPMPSLDILHFWLWSSPT